MSKLPADLSSMIPRITGHGDRPAPRRKTTTPSNRKDTILNLVEILLQQSDEGIGESEQAPGFEADRDVPTVDEHLQAVGAEAFYKFQKKVNYLDKELRNFANAARQLGSSVGILSNGFNLRMRIAQILFLYHENSADLFPRKISHVNAANSSQSTKQTRRQRKQRTKGPPALFRPSVNTDKLDPECFPEQFESLAKDVKNFLASLNEFPEFQDDSVAASVARFEQDLKYWASCLREYQGQFRYPAVQRYVHDLAGHMGEHIDNISTTLNMFVEVGVPTIRFSQQHGANNLLNLSTVATFFSSVTATAMQFSFTIVDSKIGIAVNTFWFCSLVFSIAAAVNSLLAYTWKQAMYRSPGHRVPWWVLIWIKRSPLVLLVLSVACFSVGLCCFTYASHQDSSTCVITTVLTCITSFGLVAVSAWFASERAVWLRWKGRRWLDDTIDDATNRFYNLPGVRPVRQGAKTTVKKVRRASMNMGKRTVSLMSTPSSEDEKDDLESGVLPRYSPERIVPGSVNGSRFDLPGSVGARQHGKSFSSDAQSLGMTPQMASEPSTPGMASARPSTDRMLSTPAPSPNLSRGRELWRNALRTVRLSNHAFTGQTRVNVPVRQRTTSSTRIPSAMDRKATMLEALNKGPSRSRVAALTPRLKQLDVTQDLAAHQALVRHLQFSPDGKYLATSSWDRTAMIQRVGNPFTSHRLLAHPQGFVGQVAWSPDSKVLLTKLTRGVKVWTAEDGVCTKTIDRGRYVESISWCPDGNSFLSVEGSFVAKLDLKGNLLDDYHLERMKLHDVAMTPDNQRLLGIGPLLRSQDGLNPSTSRVEKRLVVYNVETKQIEHQTPVLNDVRDITLGRNTKNGLVALVSYENKAPPQLWRIEMVKDRETNVYSARFSLRHTYMPKMTVDFAGPSYFGGVNDNLILCAGKAGDIHIWDRESGALLHHIKAAVSGADLTCIAWCPTEKMEDPFMFAVGAHDGSVRIWSKPPDIPEEDLNRLQLPLGDLNRSSSPSAFGLNSRTESPTTQQEFEESRAASFISQPGTSEPPRERTVAFANEPSLNVPSTVPFGT